MDGIRKFNDPSRHLLVLAATTDIDALDEAVLRPGRFDQHIRIDPPNERGRSQILEHKLSKIPVDFGDQYQKSV